MSLETANATKSANSSKSARELISEAKLDLSDRGRALVESRLLEMPLSCRMGYLKSLGGNSPMSGIKAHCLECVGWVRDEVRLCTSPCCALYPYRPFK